MIKAMRGKKQLIGFRASNDNGKTWFNWVYNNIQKTWFVDEPESLVFSTENMFNNTGGYTRCEPIYKIQN